MTEKFKNPDNNPWGTLSAVTGENNQKRLHDIVAVYDALGALLYRGEARGKLTYLDAPETVNRLNAVFKNEFPGVPIGVSTIMEFISVHGEPDEYGAGVISRCTGITDRFDPSEEALAQARRILSKL